MRDIEAPLVRRIERYLKKTKMKPSRFGREAAGNSMFIKRLSQGTATLALCHRVAKWLDKAEGKA